MFWLSASLGVAVQDDYLHGIGLMVQSLGVQYFSVLFVCLVSVGQLLV